MEKASPVGGTLPAEGTDCRILLDALIEAAPDPFWSPNAKLGVTAHSRVCELRKLGWTIESVSRRAERHDAVRAGRRVFGYRLIR